MPIIFNEDLHKYSIVDRPEIELTSVSKIIEMFKQPFDKEYWATRKAKERGITKEEILKEWDEKRDTSLERGTAHHKMREEEILKRVKVQTLNHGEDKLAHDLRNLEAGIYPELIVYDLLHKAVGTADLVTIYDDKSFDLEDYKTNKKLAFNSVLLYQDGERKPKKMKQPVSHLEDCNGMHYSLQLSLYAYMLEGFGYTCKKLIIHHIIFDEDGHWIDTVKYPVNYMKKECTLIFKHLKSKFN